MRKIDDIIWVDEVDSTNNMAKCHMSEYKGLTVLSARCQTGGRGQRGNTWSAETGKNLTFSIIMKAEAESGLDMDASDQFVLSQLTSAAVIEFLDGHQISAKIKWPNDIYVGDRKICGILIENTVQGNRLGSAIIGIGLNINQTRFPQEIHPEPTSIALETGQETNIRNALEEFLDIFSRYARFITAESEYWKLDRIYNGFLYRKDEEHRFILKATGKEFKGTIRGTGPGGLLHIEMNEGETLDFAFNEIAYII